MRGHFLGKQLFFFLGFICFFMKVFKPVKASQWNTSLIVQIISTPHPRKGGIWWTSWMYQNSCVPWIGFPFSYVYHDFFLIFSHIKTIKEIGIFELFSLWYRRMQIISICLTVSLELPFLTNFQFKDNISTWERTE